MRNADDATTNTSNVLEVFKFQLRGATSIVHTQVTNEQLFELTRLLRVPSLLRL